MARNAKYWTEEIYLNNRFDTVEVMFGKYLADNSKP